jgi:hypothetical protein
MEDLQIYQLTSYDLNINVEYNGTVYQTPFSLTIYVCADPNCLECLEDSYSFPKGSQICTQCAFYYLLENDKCDGCGNGGIDFGEKCDDGDEGGCTEDCTSVSENYECTGGDEESPSICKCKEGFVLIEKKCL